MPDLYADIIGKLQGRYGKGEARALARIIIEDILHLPLPRVMAGLVPKLGAKEGRIIEGVIRRLLDDEPIQYIVGSTEFCGNTIKVNPSVLIPRPETEQLVDIALSLLPEDNDAAVMDACTGSGCIAIALKTARPHWKVSGCDISAEALQTARENSKLNSADVDFIHADITLIHADTTFIHADATLKYIDTALNHAGSTPSHTAPSPHKRTFASQICLAEAYSLIVSNPPYVLNEEKSSMKPHVLNREPHLALFVPDSDPLVHYRAIAWWGKQSLKPSGWIAVEINPILHDKTHQLFDNYGYSHCEVINDIYGKERFLICRK